MICLVALCIAVVLGGQSLVQRIASDASFARFIERVLTPSTLTGAESGRSAGIPPGKQVLRLPGGDPPTLDPHLSGDSTSAEYIVEIFSGLMAYDRDLNLVPDLAERWQVNEQGTSYTFFLRKDATFHDGKPVRAQDFKWSFERACDPRTRSITADTYLGDILGCRDKLRGQADQVKGVEVLDDFTLRLTIDQPRVYFLSKMSFPAAFVLDRDNVERGGANWTASPNSTGPFKLAEIRPRERIVLQRNERYYREPKPLLERIEFVLAGGSAMVMYEQGDLDMTPVGLIDVERVSDPHNPLNRELQLVESLGVYYIEMNTRQPPFDDVKVRQAFNYALDRERIINLVYKKTRQVAWGIVPPSMPNYSNPDLQPLRYDPEKALQLISESKYGDVTEFPDITFHVLGAGGTTGRVIEAIVTSYRQNLGIDIQVQQTDWATYLRDLNDPNNTNQMWGGEAGWIADYPDPHNFLDVLFRCDSKQNHNFYCNPEVDKLLDQAAVEKDPKVRGSLYRQVEQQVVNDAPWVPLFFDVQYWLVKPYVKNAWLPPMVAPKFQYYYLER